MTATSSARTSAVAPAAGPTDLEQHELARVLARLTAAFPAVHPDDVAEQVRRADHRFDGCRVRTYVPLFVERSARAALRLPAAP